MRFAIVDLSGSISRADLEAYAAAQQRQLREHYAPYFDGNGEHDKVRVVSTPASYDEMLAASLGEVAVRLHGKVPQANENDDAIGEHDRDADTGMPTCDVYLDIAKEQGVSWTSCASHEVLEARTDPRGHMCIELDDGTIIDYEVCDRVEGDTYELDGVELSNFNTPQCFEPAEHALFKEFDFLGKSTKPNEVRPDGYAQVFDMTRGWKQVGEMRGYRKALATLGLSRGARRHKRRSQDRKDEKPFNKPRGWCDGCNGVPCRCEQRA